MGVPTKIKKEFSINALPIRAYVKIWNEFFRDENVDNTAVLKTDDANVDYEFGNENLVQEAENNACKGGNLLPVNKFHDYFTSCLPYPQRGPEVTVPMTGDAPVLLGELENGKVKPFESTYQIWLNGTGAGGGKAYNRSYGNTPKVAELGGVEKSGEAPDPN